MVNKYEFPSAKFLINAEADIRKKSMQMSVSEVLREADEAKSREEKIAILRKHHKPAMNTILQSVFDPGVKWLLPEGPIEYTPTEFLDVEGRLYQEAKKLYLFVEGGNPGLSDERRLQLFMQVLESVTPADAELLVQLKDKKMPYETITPDLVNEAYGTNYPVEEKATNVEDSSAAPQA